MRIGVPKEIKNREHRVALTPAGVKQLCDAGHDLLVEASAGSDSGFSDSAYLQAGATICSEAEQVWASELVVKVKEPLPSEYQFFRDDLTLFTFLHLAAVPALAKALMAKGSCAIGYETVQLASGELPLLTPMSQIAGKVAAQLAIQYLQKENGSSYQGIGRLIGKTGALPAARAVILGAGNVGLNAAELLAALGAEVCLLEADNARLQALQGSTQENIQLSPYTHKNLISLLPTSDLVIGATLIPGEHAPMLIRRSDLAEMKPGSVFIDVAIDQGGISETSHATSFADPLYIEAGVLHCCLPNLPAAVPQSSTAALTQATLPYIQLLADLGVHRAIAEDPAIKLGVNVMGGEIVHKAVKASLSQLL